MAVKAMLDYVKARYLSRYLGEKGQGIVEYALILTIINPSYLTPLLEEQIGRIAIGVALVLELIGFFVIHRIVDIEV